jgi:hypothetical protein
MNTPIGPTTASLAPLFGSTVALVPTLPALSLTEDEQRLANALATRLFQQRPYLELRGLYYDGLQKMQDLGISIPPSLSGLRTVMGWPQIGVDALDERCLVESFRYPGQTDADTDLLDLWLANQMSLESSLAHLDALVYGRSYIVVGAGESEAMPLMTVESPLNMTALWDAQTRSIRSAIQVYLNTDVSSDLYAREVSALYLPGKTIHMAREVSKDGVPTGKWEVTNQDEHGFDDPPVVRMANRQRTANREGASEITAAWMNLTDSGCRTLLGMEVGREFHAAPRRYVLGASEENFRKPDGTPISAWDTYVGKIWGLERDEEGNLPQVGQFAPSDPSVYTKLLDSYRADAASVMGVPPHYLGITSEGNPASADAIRASEARLVKRAERAHLAFGAAWTEAMKIALTIRDGQAPDDAHRIECDWIDPATPTPGATTDALQKQIAAGMVPPTSDVVLRKAGYTALQRAQLAQDRTDYEAEQKLAKKAEMAQEMKVAKASALPALPADPAVA